MAHLQTNILTKLYVCMCGYVHECVYVCLMRIYKKKLNLIIIIIKMPTINAYH